jgi:ZIP family zinc transporter
MEVKSRMLRSLLLGLLTSGSLLVGALAALRFKISHKAVGFVVAFGVGALISSVCFELVSEAFEESSGIAPVVAGLLTGALV